MRVIKILVHLWLSINMKIIHISSSHTLTHQKKILDLNKKISKSNVKLVCHATTTYVSNMLLQNLSIPFVLSLACTKLQVICSELVVRNWHYYWFPIERRRAASLNLVQHTFLRMFYMNFYWGILETQKYYKNLWSLSKKNRQWEKG